MDCSVIIPARNAARTIGECVMAVLSQSVPRELYEVIVVDDGSTDHTLAIARQRGARVIPQPALGSAAARNAGARIAKGTFLVFLDPDYVPRLDWLAQMIAPFRDAAVVGVRGASSTQESGLLPRLIQAENEDGYRRLEQQSTIDAIEGYSAAYRREAFLAAGGFDARLAAAEDVELSYRLARPGERLVFAPKAIVYHARRWTLRHYVEGKIREGLWRSLVNARHPDKRSRAHQSLPELRTQIPLATLAAASLVVGARWRWARPLAGLLLAAFTSTTVPAAWRSRRAGADVALASPALSFARGVSLGVGGTIGGATLAGQRLAHRASWLRRHFRR